MNFKSHIRKNQWEGLLKKSVICGVNAGIICWFIDWDITIYIDIIVLEEMRRKGYKSFNIKQDLNRTENIDIEGTKKRTFFDYELNKFLEEISYE